MGFHSRYLVDDLRLILGRIGAKHSGFLNQCKANAAAYEGLRMPCYISQYE
jgi:hypothetical protein